MPHTEGNNIMDTSHWPKDNETTLYIHTSEIIGGFDFAAIIQMAKDHFPDFDLENYTIRAEHIHVDHINYDLHDPSDWATFIIIEKK